MIEDSTVENDRQKCYNAVKCENEENAPHEANFLKLDCSKIKSTFGWKPRWHMEECMEKVCEFSKVWLAGGDIPAEMDKEIIEFFEEEK